MSRIYNDHLTGEARELAIETAYYDNLFNKYSAMYEMVCIQEQQMINDAEFKVFSESGTYEDYSYLLEEVANETGEQKKGILVQIAEAISKLFSSIINSIKSLFGKGDPNDEIQVDQGEFNAIDTLTKTAGGLKQAINDITSGQILKGIKEIPTAIKAIGIIGGTVATGALIKVKRSDCEQKVSLLRSFVMEIEKGVEKIKGFIPNAKPGDEENSSNSALSSIKGVLTWISNLIGKFAGYIAGSMQNVADKVKDAKESKRAEQRRLKNIEYQKQAAANGVQIIPNGKSEYRVDKNTGKVTLFTPGYKNDKGEQIPDKEVDVDVNGSGIPSAVLNAVRKATSRNAVASQNAQQAAQNAQNHQLPKIDKSNFKFQSFANKAQGVTVKLDEKSGAVTLNLGNGPKQINFNDPNQQGELLQKLGKGTFNKLKNAYNKVMQNVNASESADFKLDFVNAFYEAGFDVYRIDEDAIAIDIPYADNYVESTSESIFGYDLDNERMMQEAENFENELAELSAMFESL